MACAHILRPSATENPSAGCPQESVIIKEKANAWLPWRGHAPSVIYTQCHRPDKTLAFSSLARLFPLRTLAMHETAFDVSWQAWKRLRGCTPDTPSQRGHPTSNSAFQGLGFSAMPERVSCQRGSRVLVA